MAVVLYHFGLPGLSGGFVGVDIFFVISGFLIGGILWGEFINTGHLSLKRFYIRRIRRLAPAYVAMALVSFAAAWVVLLPFEFREFGKGLIAATLYLANVLFYRQSGYFDTGAEDKVFLHTWSLSVEEQFYIVLPVLLLLLARNRALVIAVLGGLFLASLTASITATPNNPTAAFYLFQYRAWELLAGVLLAIYGHQTAHHWRFHGALSWAGIALIFGSVVFISADRGFPGYQALFPVAGTVLILLNGRDDNVINRLLSARIPVAIGLISYSLYLWHWPVLVLSRSYFDGYAGVAEPAFWMAVSLLLAALSWRFVERPFRGAAMPSARAVFSTAGLASFTLLALGSGVYLTQGMPARFDRQVRVHINASADFLQDFSRCKIAASGPFAGLEICPIGPESDRPEVLIWGDSHLRAYYEGIAQVARETDVPALVVWHAGCPPLFGVQKHETAATPAEDAACNAANITLQSAMADTTDIKRILLVGRWSYYAQGSGYGIDSANKIILTGEDFATAATATINELARRFDEVFVLRQAPEIPQYDSRVIARRLAHGDLSDEGALAEIITVSRADLQARIALGEAPFRALDGKNMTFLDPWPMLCDASQCSAIQDGQGLYFDNNHITNTAARRLRGLFLPVFEGAKP